MRSLVLTALGGIALFAFAAPASAHSDYGDDDVHQDQHQQLDDQHHGIHDELNAIHDDAHAQGLPEYEHEQLHRQLDRAHARADGRLEAQHNYQHEAGQHGYGYG